MTSSLATRVGTDRGPEATKISFEFFPPKSLQASFDLWESLNILTPLQPTFVSVTYGAGGTTRQLTREMTEAVASKYGLDVAAHLTCVDASRAETLAIAKSYVDAGVSRIVALRGDHQKAPASSCRIPTAMPTPLILLLGWRQLGSTRFMLAPILNRTLRRPMKTPISTG